MQSLETRDCPDDDFVHAANPGVEDSERRTEASKGNEGIRIGNKGALYRCAASSTRDSSPLLRRFFFRMERLPQESKRLVATRRATGCKRHQNDHTPCNGNVCTRAERIKIGHTIALSNAWISTEQCDTDPPHSKVYSADYWPQKCKKKWQCDVISMWSQCDKSSYY
jgi:hypothetical protein